MSESKSKFSSYYPWLVWALAASFFLSEYFARVGPSIMVPELMRAFHVNALSLGALSGFFYIAYIGMQIPVGTLVDRYGPHKLLTVMAALMGLTCFLFASSSILVVAELSRFLMGLAASFAFVGTLKLATLWFPASRLGLLAGLTQALGMLGAAVGEGPIALVESHIGWRHTMMLLGVILFVVALLIGLFVRDRSKSAQAEMPLGDKRINLWVALKTVLKNPQSWLNGCYVGLVYAPTAAFAELWGVTYLVHVYGLSNDVAASAISMIFLGWAVGGPFAGLISDFMRKRKPLMYLSAAGSMLTIAAVLYLPLPIPMVFVTLFLYGVCNTGVGISYALSSEINPRPVAGTSIGFANMASVIIGACFQPIIGWMLDLQWNHVMHKGIPMYSVTSYRWAMLVLPACLFLGIVMTRFVRETNCRIVSTGLNGDESNGSGPIPLGH